MPTNASWTLTIFSALMLLFPSVLAIDTSETTHNLLYRRDKCQPGYYSNDGNTPCIPCDPGTYTKEQGQKRCTDARPGYHIPTAGATSETPCRAGTYAPNPKSTTCTPCPPGFKCPNDALHQPQQCSPGTYSVGGEVVECPRCDAGYFNNIHRATGCCACAAGWFNAHGGNTNCQQCTPQNPYSNPGSTTMSSCSATPGAWAPSQTNQQAADGTCPASQPYVAPSQLARRGVERAPSCNRVGYKACPIFGFNWRAPTSTHEYMYQTRNFECVDVQNDLESCGGCVSYSPQGLSSPDGGRDCSSIPDVWEVRCQKGRCVIDSCSPGFTVTSDGQTCVPDPRL